MRKSFVFFWCLFLANSGFALVGRGTCELILGEGGTCQNVDGLTSMLRSSASWNGLVS